MLDYAWTKNISMPVMNGRTGDIIEEYYYVHYGHNINVMQRLGWKINSAVPTELNTYDILWERERIRIMNYESIIDSHTFYFLCSSISYSGFGVRLNNRLYEFFYKEKPNTYYPSVKKRYYELFTCDIEQLIKIKGFGKSCFDELSSHLKANGVGWNFKVSKELLEKIKEKLKEL